MQKQSFDEWVVALNLLSRQLAVVRAIYAEHQRTAKVTQMDGYLGRLRAAYAPLLLVVDRPLASPAADAAIAGGLPVVSEILAALPFISTDMQQLLQSSWAGDCNGRRATDLFKGPRNSPNAGIGSGQASDGGLPETLSALIESEKYGGGARPTLGKGRTEAQVMQIVKELVAEGGTKTGLPAGTTSGLGSLG